MTQLGKLLLALGVMIMAVGLVLIFFERIPWLGKLPGDIIVKKKNFSFYFPIVTCLLLSLLFSLIFFLINRVK